MKQLAVEAAPLGISVVLAIFYFRSDLFMLSILDLDPALGYTKQEAVSLYAIPYAILVDREGKIIAKGLSGEALEQKLREVL
jgi:hypothetical protein